MKERLSALMDGHLDGESCDECLGQLETDSDLRESWSLYHVIGDALRGTTAQTLPAAFNDRLAAEPTVLAPRRAGAQAARPNRWRYALSAAAGVAAVALVGWVALPQLDPETTPLASAVRELPGAQAPARAVSAATTAGEAPVVPAGVPAARDMGDYLIAHQRFSPSSAMSGVAPYARTVSEDSRTR